MVYAQLGCRLSVMRPVLGRDLTSASASTSTMTSTVYHGVGTGTGPIRTRPQRRQPVS